MNALRTIIASLIIAAMVTSGHGVRPVVQDPKAVVAKIRDNPEVSNG